MPPVATEIAFLLVLLVGNGIFAMAEIAVVRSRRARLQQLADAGDRGAARALALASTPGRFFSIVQVGITLVGVLAGAFGGATLAARLSAQLAAWPAIAPYADVLAFTLVVSAITYASLVIGELVPKRLALVAPERLASRLAGPMDGLARLASPLVTLLERSTDAVLRLLRVPEPETAPISGQEISLLVRQGAQAGIFDPGERDIVERVFRLGDLAVAHLMTPRPQIVWIDAGATRDEVRALTVAAPHGRYPVAEGSLDRVIGVVDVKALWAAADEPLDLRAILQKPLFVPETTPALKLLESFRRTSVHVALVLDEFGGVEGLVTIHDVLESLVGELPTPDERAPGAIVRRADGTWLMDASLAIRDFRNALELDRARWPDDVTYHTVAGLVVAALQRIPRPGDAFERDGVRIEVVDMDGHRVDKVLVSRR